MAVSPSGPAGGPFTPPGPEAKVFVISVAAFSLLPQKVRSWQLLYRTTDWQGRPDATATTVLLPWGAKPDKSRPLLSYQVAQDSTAPQCVPSHVLQQGSGFEGIVTQAELLLIDAAVRQGWAVSVPDHEGRGGHLGVAKEPGYLALDGIRAAENFAPLGLNGADTKVGMWGYSGGGLATGWTVEMQPGYAPELNVAGAAMGGPVPNLVSLLERANGQPFAGLIPLGIAALRKTYPQIAEVVNTYLTPEGQAIIDRADTECTQQTAARYPFVDFNNYTRIPLHDVVQLPEVQEVAEDVRLGNHAPTAPLYVYHSVNDELPAIGDTDHQVANYCVAGDVVTYKRDILSEHVSLVITGAAGALNWLKQRLSGAPAPPACTTETVVSTLASPSALATFGTVLLQDLLALLGQPIRPTDIA